MGPHFPSLWWHSSFKDEVRHKTGIKAACDLNSMLRVSFYERQCVLFNWETEDSWIEASHTLVRTNDFICFISSPEWGTDVRPNTLEAAQNLTCSTHTLSPSLNTTQPGVHYDSDLLMELQGCLTTFTHNNSNRLFLCSTQQYLLQHGGS